MDSIESFNNFIVNSLPTLIIFTRTFDLVGKQYADVRFVENQVIRDEKINIEKLRTHPFFFLYHSEPSDSCGPFYCREELDSFLRPRTDSVFIPPLLALCRSFPSRIKSSLLAMFRFLSSCMKPPPEFFCSKFQWYRRLPSVLQWIIFMSCFVCSKMFKACKTACSGFWSTVWSCLCWIGLAVLNVCCFPCICLKKICCWSRKRAPPPDLENGHQQQNGINSYGSVQVRPSPPRISSSSNTNQTQQPSHSNKSGNNEQRAPSPLAPQEPSPPKIGNNEPTTSTPFSSDNELKSLKKSVKAVTISESNEVEESLDEYEKQMKEVAEVGDFGKEFKKKKEELERTIQEQKEIQESLKNEKEPSFDSESEELREMEENNKKKRDEQDRRNKEELEEMRRKRREKQKKLDEELLEMRKEFQKRLATLLYCIQMRIRFEQKEEEWGDFLRGIRQPLIKVSTSANDLHDEFRMSYDTDEEKIECIVTELKFLANLVNIAQNVLANAYYFLEEQSEMNDDRIFLKMIMKSILIEGQHCDSIGNSLSELNRSPLNKNLQDRCKETISKLNAHSIPTTQKLKTDSVNAREEDYFNLGRFPEPDWFSTI